MRLLPVDQCVNSGALPDYGLGFRVIDLASSGHTDQTEVLGSIIVYQDVVTIRGWWIGSSWS